jgi:uncharacterized protein YukE
MTDTNTAQLVVDLKATDQAVNAKGWVAPGLGVPGAPLGMLGSSLNPLTGLAAAGLSWFMPLVSFLGEPLTQLQGGNAGSVTSGSQDFDEAGQDIAGVAGAYRQSAGAQTSEWSGTAASDYRDAATQHADGIAGLGEASNTVGSAIIGAGQVVAQAIAEVTELIAEAVAQIVPIMTQAVARAGETFGQSVVEAIPPCVAIAVEYALRIAAKLAALVASGNNLLKLVQGALGVVDLIKAALTTISKQSVQADGSASTAASGGAGAEPPPGGDLASTLAAADPGKPAGEAGSAGAGASSPSSSGGGSGSGLGSGFGSGFGGGSDGVSTPGRSATPPDIGTRSSGVVPQVPSISGTGPDASRFSSGAVSSGSVAGGGVQMGAAPLAPGARVGGERGADTVRQEARQQAAVRAPRGGGGAPGAMPMGVMGAGRQGSEDKEHERKFTVVEQHDEVIEAAPEVITNER